MEKHEPADFTDAFAFLEYFDEQGKDIDWELIKFLPVAADILLIGIMYKVKNAQQS